MGSFRRLTLDNALVEIVVALAARRVRPLLLKGPAFARWLYDDPRERPYGDIDLLVAPDEYLEARAVLAELGYQPVVEGKHPVELCHAELWGRPGLVPVDVELHHTFHFLSASASAVWQALTHETEVITITGTEINVPSAAASALIVALHAASHGQAGKPQARHDLQRALQRVDFETWRAAASIADELAAGPAFAAGLRLEPAGRDVASRLELTEVMPRYIGLRIANSPETAIGIERLISAPGMRSKLLVLAYELVPSREFMLATSATARRGPFGLACAYFWRPFELVRKLPRGLHAWLKARAREHGPV
jgi:hypothetical protein